MVLRIKEYIDFKGISVSQFERKAGLSNGILGKAIKANGAIGSDKLEDILRTYPDINPIWLTTGRGSMLTDVHADTSVAGENLLSERPASAPAEAIQAHTATKAPRMGNYASDRIIEEKQKAYERQIADMKEELMNAYMKIGYLTAEKEELKASLDTKPADHAGDATGVPVLKDKAS